MQEALDPPNISTLKNLRALFLTHLHSDHTVDYPNLLLYGPYSGLESRAATPLQVYGPGVRGEMEPVFALPGSVRPAPEVINPGNPTPGTEDMTAYLYQAFATDLNDRMRDGGKPDVRLLVHAHDIKLPHIPGFMSLNQTPSPDMEPFKVIRGRQGARVRDAGVSCSGLAFICVPVRYRRWRDCLLRRYRAKPKSHQDG
jgi:ribonuclease BN (tRNA processing enzyme)